MCFVKNPFSRFNASINWLFLNERLSGSLNKLSLFQKNDSKFSRKCPLSVKNAPIVDYKNVSLLKKYMSDNGKIISSKITSVSFGKQKKLTREIKKAKILGLL